MAIGFGQSDGEFRHCACCGILVDLGEHHPTVVATFEAMADEWERVTYHFCSDDCLDDWTGPFDW